MDGEPPHKYILSLLASFVASSLLFCLLFDLIASTPMSEEEILIILRITFYIVLFYLIATVLLKINERVAVLFILGLFSLFFVERSTLWFARKLDEGFLVALILYTFPLIFFSSYLLKEKDINLYTLILGCLVCHRLVDLGILSLANTES